VWSQKFGEMLRNPIYMGVLDAPDYGVQGQRGDFAPLVSEKVFYRVQAVLEGRTPTVTPHLRSRPISPCEASFGATRAVGALPRVGRVARIKASATPTTTAEVALAV
jgi:hypothetical protein